MANGDLDYYQTFVQPPQGGRANPFAGASQLGAASMNPYAAAGGIALEFAGNLMAANEGISRRTRRRRGRAALAQARASDALFSGLERSELLAGQKGERQGFTGAARGIEAGAQQARQRVQTQGRARQGSLEQSLVGRGLLGTSTGLQSLAGVQGQTSAQLASIDQQLAMALGELGLQEGALLGRQGRERSGLAAKNRAFQEQLSQAEFGLLTM